MRNHLLLYGANGFTGRLTAQRAVEQGLRPILAGRNAAKVGVLATELGLEHRDFGVDDTAAMEAAFRDVSVVLNCAGPFIHTYRPLVEMCLRLGVHYLDITGEIPVFDAIAARDTEARARGVMLMPGAGYDVVPSDCLALHLKHRLPSATHLTIAFATFGPASFSRGTAFTGIELLGKSGVVRREGKLVAVPFGWHARQVDLGRGPVVVTAFPWGDIFTAFYSTGIGNIDTYLRLPPNLASLLKLIPPLQPLLRRGVVKDTLRRLVRLRAPGPTAEQRARTRTVLYGEVRDVEGRTAAARMQGPEAGNTWTPIAAIQVAGRVLAGESPAGYQTPARAYGPDFALEGEAVTRTDL